MSISTSNSWCSNLPQGTWKSRCCCNETPSTAGRNKDHFYPHFIQKLFSKTLCHAIYALDTQCNPFHTAYACNKCVHYWQKHNFVNSSIMQVKIIKFSSCRWWCFLTATSAIRMEQLMLSFIYLQNHLGKMFANNGALHTDKKQKTSRFATSLSMIPLSDWRYI